MGLPPFSRTSPTAHARRVRSGSTHAAVALLAVAIVAVAGCDTSVRSPAPSQAVSVATMTPAPVATPTTRPVAVATPLPTGTPRPTFTLPPAAHRAQTIHLTLRPGNDTYVSVGAATGCTSEHCQGDYLIGDDGLFDADTGAEVGWLIYVEFAVDSGTSLFHSPANTITLIGRGDIVFSETLLDFGSGVPATGTILGGTGEFLGVTGSIVSTSLGSTGDFVITING